MADATHGHLRVGVGAFFAQHVFPDSLLRFVVDYPNVDITVIEATSQDLYDAMLGGELDFVISTPALEVDVPPQFESELLFETRNALFVREAHPLADREQVSMRDFAELPWIVSARFANYRARLEGAFRAEGLEPPARIMRTDSVPLIGQVLQNSDAVALLGSTPFRDLALPALGQLKAFELPAFSGTYRGVLAWRRSALLPAAGALMQRLRANLTFFYLIDKQFQSPSAFVDAIGVTQFITRNDADFKNQGVELELQAVPIDGLNLYASLGYQDAKYDNVAANTLQQQTDCRTLRATNQAFSARCGAGIVTAQGNISDPVRTPELTAAIGGSYDIRLGANWTLTPAINFVYQSDTETAAANASFYLDQNGIYNIDGRGSYVSGSLQEAYTLVNASVALSGGPDQSWKLVLDCDNCSNEAYTQSAISGYSFLNPPRTWSVRLGYSF